MTYQTGQYIYGRHGSFYAIFIVTDVRADGSGYSAKLVDREQRYRRIEEARARVYQLNGWKQKSQPS